MSSPTFITVDPDVEIRPCPFCGGKPALYSIEPYGYWGGGYHPQVEELSVRCRECGAEGPRVECKVFANWTEFRVADFREDKPLWQKEHDRWQAYHGECKTEAITKWNERK